VRFSREQEIDIDTSSAKRRSFIIKNTFEEEKDVYMCVCERARARVIIEYITSLLF